jgi:uracil-DNA glycosylase
MAVPEGIGDWAQLAFFSDLDENGMTPWDRVSARLNDETAADRPWQPNPEYLFRALQLTPPAHVRVVLIGQDPYPRQGAATGLAFSLPEGSKPRHSLKRILDKLEVETGVKRESGCLDGWATAGMLLINCALTVTIGSKRSHSDFGWDELCVEVLKTLSAQGSIVFWALGQDAQTLCRRAEVDEDSNLLIRTSHPMARKNATNYLGDIKIFDITNKWRRRLKLPPINWGNT